MYFYRSLKQIIIAIIMPATKEKRKTAVLQLRDPCRQAIALSESPVLGAKVEGRIAFENVVRYHHQGIR